MEVRTIITNILYRRLQKRIEEPSDELPLLEWTSIGSEYKKFYESRKDAGLEPEYEQVLQARVTNYHIVQERMAKDLKKARVAKLRRRLLIAASIVTLAASAPLIWRINDTTKDDAGLGDGVMNIDAIAPASNKAILVMGNGKRLMLDSFSNGVITVQGGATVTSRKGAILEYQSDDDNKGVTTYHTITTPKGGLFQIGLSDGSRVWLNTASSLSYPTKFAQEGRVVSLTGEAYFEVAHDPLHPFTVVVNTKNVATPARIVVLGTHFNIKAYEPDRVIKATLLEGAVNVRYGDESMMLRPGQQASIRPDAVEPLKKESKVSMLEVEGWRNGYFVFENADLAEIIEEVARWYALGVKWEITPPSEGINATIGRQTGLRKTFEILKLSGKLRLEVRDQVIHVFK